MVWVWAVFQIADRRNSREMCSSRTLTSSFRVADGVDEAASEAAEAEDCQAKFQE